MTFKMTAVALAAALSLGTSANAMSITEAYGSCDTSSLLTGLTVDACGADPRDKVANVNLGAGDGSFYSLGLNTSMAYGGAALFRISPAFTGPAMVVEVTNPSDHWEAAEVYVGNSLSEIQNKFNNNRDYDGIVNNGKGGSEAASTTVTINGVYSLIMFADASFAVYGDATAGNKTKDGFDLDSFTVTPVPLPAGALLLGTALAGLGLSRRRA